MVKIMSDTSTLYTVEQGAALGMTICPLSVALDGVSYAEFEDVSSAEFIALVRGSQNTPTSSQPPLGSVLAAYDALAGDQLINITMADGLSGTYQSACAARERSVHKDDITVFNSQTLCGPHRYMVMRANEMAHAGATRDEILAALQRAVARTRSYLTVADFDFLRRGGRLSPLAAKMMSKLKAIPVVVLSGDGKKLEPHMLHRSRKMLLRDLATALKRFGLGEDRGAGWLVSVSHADNPSLASDIVAALSDELPAADVEKLELSPAFVTQGGPECVSIQTIREW